MSVEPTRNPPAISEIVGPIDRRLTEVLNIERSKWVAVDASLAEPFDALEALILAEGKEFAQLFFIGRMLALAVTLIQELLLTLLLRLKCCMHLHLHMMM